MNFRWSPLNILGPFLVISVFVGRAIRRIVPDPIGVGLLVVIAVAALALLFVGLRERRRSTALKGFAARWNAKYHPALRGHPYGLSTFPFDQGHHRMTLDFIGGRWDAYPASAFVVEFSRGRLNMAWVNRFQVVALRLPQSLPSVQLIPLDTIANASVIAGGQKIDFESHKFNQNWRVMGTDARHVHDIVHPRLMERLNLSSALGRPIVLEKDMLFTWSAKRMTGVEIPEAWKLLTEVASSIPAHVWKDRGTPVPRSEA